MGGNGVGEGLEGGSTDFVRGGMVKYVHSWRRSYHYIVHASHLEEQVLKQLR